MTQNQFDQINQRLDSFDLQLQDYKQQVQENRASISTLQVLGAQLLEIVKEQSRQIQELNRKVN